MGRKRHKFVMKRLDNIPKQEVKDHLKKQREEAMRIVKELFPETHIDAKYLEFPEIDMAAHNQVVDITADNWAKANYSVELLKLREHLKELLHHMYKTDDPEQLVEKINNSIEEKKKKDKVI